MDWPMWSWMIGLTPCLLWYQEFLSRGMPSSWCRDPLTVPLQATDSLLKSMRSFFPNHLDLLLHNIERRFIPHCLSTNRTICSCLTPPEDAISMEGMVAKTCGHRVTLSKRFDANGAGVGVSLIVCCCVGLKVAADRLLCKDYTSNFGAEYCCRSSDIL